MEGRQYAFDRFVFPESVPFILPECQSMQTLGAVWPGHVSALLAQASLSEMYRTDGRSHSTAKDCDMPSQSEKGFFLRVENLWLP